MLALAGALGLCAALHALPAPGRVAGAASAQASRDPLTPDEADQLRGASGFLDKRVALLLQFARQRIVDFNQTRLMSPRPPGRANTLYVLLRQYEAILPEIDDNLDAIADGYVTSVSQGDKFSLVKVSGEVIDTETAMRAMLVEIQNSSSAPDLASYRFVLQDCLDTTDDSLENAREDRAEATGKKKGKGGGGGDGGGGAGGAHAG